MDRKIIKNKVPVRTKMRTGLVNNLLIYMQRPYLPAVTTFVGTARHMEPYGSVPPVVLEQQLVEGAVLNNELHP